MCVADGTGAVLFRTVVPGGGRCGPRPCWKAVGHTGFRYQAPRSDVAVIRKIVLKAEANGEASIRVSGTMTPSASALPLGVPATVRLVGSRGCWAGSFGPDGVVQSTPARFVGKGQ